MRQLLILIVVLLLIAGVLYAFLYFNDVPISELTLSDISVDNVQALSGPGLVARRALLMWDRGEYAKLYRVLSMDVRRAIPENVFLESRNPLLIGGVLKPEIDDVKEEGDRATVTATVSNPDIQAITAQIFEASEEKPKRGKKKEDDKPSAGHLERQKIVMELVKENDQWMISQFEPITRALQQMAEQRKSERAESRAEELAEDYVDLVTLSELRATSIHTYGPEPFIVGVVTNRGNRDVLRLGIRFTILDAQGNVLAEDTYHPVVEDSISTEEKPLRPGQERKISYQIDKVIEGFEDTRNVRARIIELRVGPEYEDEASKTDRAKDKIRRAREREEVAAKNVVDLSS